MKIERHGLTWNLLNPCHRAILEAIEAGGVTGGQDAGDEPGGDTNDAGDDVDTSDDGDDKNADDTGKKPDGSTLGAKPTDGTQDKSGGDGGGTSKKDESSQSAELELTVPEGMQADESLLGEFKTFATEAKLSNEQASAVLAFEHQRNQKALESLETERKSWRDEIVKDAKYGGDNHATTVQNARVAIEQYAGDEAPKVFELFQQLGVDEHPALVRMFANIGKAGAEDSTGGRSSEGGPLTRDERLKRLYSKSGG